MALVTRTYDLTDPDAQARWQALWVLSPQRTPFSALPYLVATSEVYQLPARIHFVQNDGVDEAGQVVFVKKKGPFRLGVIPPLMPYSPLLLRDELHEPSVLAGQSPFDLLLESLSTSYHAASFFCNAITDVRAGKWRSWTIRPFYTYTIPSFSLYPGISAWSKKGARHVFRKHKASYSLKSLDCADAVVAHCSQSYQRNNRTIPGGESSLLLLLESLINSNLVHLYGLEEQETQRLEAALAILQDGRTACYWLGGSLPGPAMTVLLGTLILKYQEDGFQDFDLVGANTPSIAAFKRKFGPTLSPYFHFERIMRPELRLLSALKRLVSHRSA